MPGIFHPIGDVELAKVNLPVAVLIWLMVIPMLIRVDFAALGQVRQYWRGISVTLFINWAVKPFSMAALGWLFVGRLFRPYLPADQINSYIAGLIILAAAPCTAMVFVWSNLTKGEPHFTLSQVALNDTIMVFAFAPLVGGLLKPHAGGDADQRGSQSFNAVNQFRILGRWMRMFTIPNQSSVAKAFQEFDDSDRMMPSPSYDRVVDVIEKLVKFTFLTRGASTYLTDRYSERTESAEQLSARVNMRAI